MIRVHEIIKASREDIWKLITDIERAEENISAITKIKILEKPNSDLVGLKWEETRVMFGKEATETMVISAAEPNQWYETTAHNCGCEYKSRLQIDEAPEGMKLTMAFSSTPQSLMAKIFAPLGLLFSGSIAKALQKDLQDIKEKLEGEL